MKLQFFSFCSLCGARLPSVLNLELHPLTNGLDSVGQTALEKPLLKAFPHHGLLKTGRGKPIYQESGIPLLLYGMKKSI